MQKVVRTYPGDYNFTTEELNTYLNKGWRVVMCNTFMAPGTGSLLGQIVYGNEYIIERDDETDRYEQQ